jgi:Ca2+-binding RTX toxin-like protein
LPAEHGIAITNDFGNTIIEGSPGDDHSTITSDGTDLTIHSDEGVISRFGCTQTDASTTSCPVRPQAQYQSYAGDDVAVFSLPTLMTLSACGSVGNVRDSGDDRFELTRGSVARARLSGAGGDDVLIAAAGHYDSLIGGPGDDRLLGRANQDRLSGSRGRDVLIGGTGDDRLEAADGRRDRAIKCGPGTDIAIVDDRDPRPTDCENVERR